MQIGALTARFGGDKWSLDQILDWASKTKIDCLEVSVRHGHFNVDQALQKGSREDLLHKFRAANVGISALACYSGDITSPEAPKRQAAIDELLKTIDAAAALNVGIVCALAGMPLPGKSKMDTIREDLPGIFGPILEHARKKNVRIALENWWRTNIQHLDHWKALFEVLPQENLGLNFDPSHLDKMEIDYLSAVSEFKSRIFHTHAKDVVVNYAHRRRVGVFDGADSRFTIPGTGRIQWPEYIGRLREIGYNGVLSIEHEDGTFSSVDGFRVGAAYLRQFI